MDVWHSFDDDPSESLEAYFLSNTVLWIALLNDDAFGELVSELVARARVFFLRHFIALEEFPSLWYFNSQKGIIFLANLIAVYLIFLSLCPAFLRCDSAE